MSGWFVVHAKSRQETLALAHLERQDYTAFLPRIRRSRRRRGRWQAVTEPLFPGYLFTRLDLGADDIAPIRSTRGVLGLVRFGAQPAAVPGELITQLQSLVSTDEAVVGSEPDLIAGDPVRIVDGPLAGHEALFQSAPADERVCVLMHLLGRSQTVTLARDQVVPTADRAPVLTGEAAEPT